MATLEIRKSNKAKSSFPGLQGRFDFESPGFEQGLRDVLGIILYGGLFA